MELNRKLLKAKSVSMQIIIEVTDYLGVYEQNCTVNSVRVYN